MNFKLKFTDLKFFLAYHDCERFGFYTWLASLGCLWITIFFSYEKKLLITTKLIDIYSLKLQNVKCFKSNYFSVGTFKALLVIFHSNYYINVCDFTNTNMYHMYMISILEEGSRFFNELLQQSRIFNEAKNGNYSYFPTLLRVMIMATATM